MRNRLFTLPLLVGIVSSGYSNDIFAYIPSLRVLREGGYEGGDAMSGQLPGPFGAAIEEIIVEKVTDLVKATNPGDAH